MRITAWTVAGLLALGVLPASAQDRLTINGFLNQGFATSTAHSVHGVPSDRVAADYRSASLLFRALLTETDNLVVQFSHRSLGASLLTETQDDVTLKWAYYQKRIGQTTVSAGRVPLSKGIFNEVRDVGTLLPFYRAPYNTYTEGMEVVDGVQVSHQVQLPAGFRAELSVFGGGWDFVQLTRSATTGVPYINTFRSDDAFGGQAALALPVPGLTLGVFAQSFGVEEPAVTGSEEKERGHQLSGFAELARDRYFVRGEMGRFDPGLWAYSVGYAQGGVRVLEKLWLNVQHEQAELLYRHPQLGDAKGRYALDSAVGVKYDLTPAISFKLEGHRVEGHQTDSAGPLMAFTPPTTLTVAPGLKTDYVIASISFTF